MLTSVVLAINGGSGLVGVLYTRAGTRTALGALWTAVGRPAAPDQPGRTIRKHRANPERAQMRTGLIERIAIILAIAAAAVYLTIGWKTGGKPPSKAKARLGIINLLLPLSCPLPDSVVRLAVWLLKHFRSVEGVRLSTAWMKPASAARTVKEWWQHLVTYGTLLPRHNAPRKRLHPVPDDVLDACIKAIVSTTCHSKADACFQCPLIREVCEKYGCSLIYLWRLMLGHCPRFQKCLRIEPRMMLTAEHKRARVAYCLLMIEEWLNNQLAGYVWIDQKKMWVHPGAGGVFCWSLKGQTSTEQPRVIETLLMSKEYKGCCNYSYQAANAILGPFFIAFTTGTHGHYLKSNTPNKMHYWGLGYKVGPLMHHTNCITGLRSYE